MAEYTTAQAEELQRIHNALERAAPKAGVFVTRNQVDGKLTFRFKRELDPIEKERVKLALAELFPPKEPAQNNGLIQLLR